MLATEYRRRNESQIGRRAKSARRTSAFTQPKASAPKLHHPDVATSKPKTPEQKRSRVLELPISNGASPVASALGIRLGATPRGLHQPNMASPARLSKQDISTLLGLGRFLFCFHRTAAQRLRHGESCIARSLVSCPKWPVSAEEQANHPSWSVRVLSHGIRRSDRNCATLGEPGV